MTSVVRVPSVARLSPQALLIASMLAFACTQLSPVDQPLGCGLVVAVVLGMRHLSRLPWRRMIALCVLGLGLFGPVFLLLPWLEASSAAPLFERLGLDARWAAAWRVFARGLGALLVATPTALCLGERGLAQALWRLRVPAVVRALLVQILHQLAVLGAETRRIRTVLLLRGAASSYRGRLRLLVALSRVWLPRVGLRAERLARVMELRAYDGRSAPLEPESWRRADALAIGLAAVALATSALLRLGVWAHE